MAEFSFDALRRFPDVEAPNLFAADASDRLILDEAAEAISEAPHGSVVVVGDRYGALTLGAARLHGASALRVHQDALSGELALAANAERFGLGGAFRSLDLGAALFAGARVVLVQLPRSLDALDEIAEGIARWADPEVLVFSGGRVKHLAPAMNEVLSSHFTQVRAGLARQKSRVIRSSGPRPAGAPRFPLREHHADLGLTVAAHGAVFAGAKVDIGTRFLLGFLPALCEAPGQVPERAIDLGCGTGVLAVSLARSLDSVRVIASDQSAAAVASARATIAANDRQELRLAERIEVVRDDALASQPDDSADLILLNPPFHVGAAVYAGIALKLFEDAARVLRPGGRLAVVWNSHLGYRAPLERIVGPTVQLARNQKFTITSSRTVASG